MIRNPELLTQLKLDRLKRELPDIDAASSRTLADTFYLRALQVSPGTIRAGMMTNEERVTP